MKKDKESMFSRFSSRRKEANSPENFADTVDKADKFLESLLIEKKADLKNEKGQESYNSKALNHLESMRFHLDCLIEHAGAYADLK